jgi:multiple sugar transport system substrate-binding protein
MKKSKLLFISLVMGMLLMSCPNVPGSEEHSSSLEESSSEDLSSEESIEDTHITIQFWTGFGATVSNILEDLIDDFMDENPDINVVHESKGGYDNLQTAINLSVSSETYPNVALGYPDHFAGYIASNIMVPLDSYIEGENGIDLSDFYQDYLNENQRLVYRRDPITNLPDPENPYTMGLPFNKSTEVMIYNKTFFDWAVTQDEDIVVPETWQQAHVVGEKILNLLDTGNDGGSYFGTQIMDGTNLVLDFTNVARSTFKPLSYDSQANFFITAISQWGGVYTEMGTDIRSGFVRFNSAETLAALTFFQDMFKAGVLGIPQTWEERYASTPFNTLRTLMTISSSAGVTYNFLPSGGLFTPAIAAIPYNADNAISGKAVISQGTNLALFDRGTPEQKEAAWKLIKYLTSEVNDRFAVGAAYFPVSRSMSETDYYQGFMNAPAIGLADSLKRQAMIINEQNYTVEGTEWLKFVDPAFVGSSTIRDRVDRAMFLLFYSPGATPQSVINTLYVQLTEFVE